MFDRLSPRIRHEFISCVCVRPYLENNFNELSFQWKVIRERAFSCYCESFAHTFRSRCARYSDRSTYVVCYAPQKYPINWVCVCVYVDLYACA